MSDGSIEPRQSMSDTSTTEGVPTTAAAALRGIAVVLLVLGDVLAFNQLATQSPTDAIIQLSVVGIGFAGAIDAIRRLACARTRTDRLLGLPIAMLAIAAIIGWRARWPIGSEVLTCAVAAALSVVVGLRSLARADRDPAASQLPGVFSLAQALVFAWFAVLAALSARAVLFG